ncbi:hypothetical protein G5V59_12920 [Nocardioides sp. W3-2-3]|nr:hypothetical protein [Nocardioides convexus]
MLALALLAGGCGGSSDEGSSSSSDDDRAGYRRPGSDLDLSQFDKPCPLLLPDPVVEFLDSDVYVEHMGPDLCRLYDSDNEDYVSVWLGFLVGDEGTPAQAFTEMQARVAKPEDLEGIGDAAIYVPYDFGEGDGGPFAAALVGEVIVKIKTSKGTRDSPEAKAMLIEEPEARGESGTDLGLLGSPMVSGRTPPKDRANTNCQICTYST